MNWLDGSVVSLSIMEIIMNAIAGGGVNLSAFRTIRVLRTFRVLRVARLLRGLKSMKVILTVI
jgi:Ion transport protein